MVGSMKKKQTTSLDLTALTNYIILGIIVIYYVLFSYQLKSEIKNNVFLRASAQIRPVQNFLLFFCFLNHVGAY